MGKSLEFRGTHLVVTLSNLLKYPCYRFIDMRIQQTLLLAGVCVWCWSGWTETKILDEYRMDSWSRMLVTDDSNGSETTRVITQTTQRVDADNASAGYLIRQYNCQKRLTIYVPTKKLGYTRAMKRRESVEIESKGTSQEPIALPTVSFNVKTESENVEVGEFVAEDTNREETNIDDLLDGRIHLTLSDQATITRIVNEFKTGNEVIVRVTAYETNYRLTLNLAGFAEKADWVEGHCLEPSDSNTMDR